MLHKINPTTTDSWKILLDEFKRIEPQHLKTLFANDENRFNKMHIVWGDFLVDFSKNRIDDTVLNTLLHLAKECKLEESIQSMYSGEKINETENRSVLHIALRNQPAIPIYVNGKDVMPEVNSCLLYTSRCV